MVKRHGLWCVVVNRTARDITPVIESGLRGDSWDVINEQSIRVVARDLDGVNDDGNLFQGIGGVRHNDCSLIGENIAMIDGVCALC